jgi:hypothetical protein
VNVVGRSLTRLDALSGEASPYPARIQGGRLEFPVELPPNGSLLLTVSNSGRLLAPQPSAATVARDVEHGSPVVVKRASPNVLRIDYCDLKLGDSVERDLWFDRAAQKAFERHGFRGNPWAGVQFRSEFLDRDKFPAGSGFEAAFHFDVEPGVSTRGIQAVVERPQLWQVLVNGEPVTARPGAWWLDAAFGVYDIGAQVRPGANTIVLKTQPMSVHAEIQPVYVLGEFGLTAQDRGFRIVAPRELSLGAWNEQQLPFYSDVVAYSRLFQVQRGGGRYEVRLERWSGTVAEVRVNGKYAGVIGWKPYQLDVTPLLREGSNEIAVLVYGSLKNLLGPHLTKYRSGLVGSWLWRTAPDRTPPGSQYDLLAYGLLDSFKLVRLSGGNLK